MTTLNDDAVLVRGMDVTARLTYSVEMLRPESRGGILLETLIGRYLLDEDACRPWLQIDGRQTVGEIAAAVAREREARLADILPPVRRLCAELTELGLVELVRPDDDPRVAVAEDDVRERVGIS